MEDMKTYDWHSLHSKNAHIIADIKGQWMDLLEKELPERIYHDYLKEYAGFFFGKWRTYCVISKLKLGSEFETDFVTVSDHSSNGTFYEIIEIEKPQSKLFTKDGLPSRDLNSSLQQVRNWRNFLKQDKRWFSKFLPAYSTRVVSNSYVKFTIIIGRRTKNLQEITMRNQIADEMNVTLRSYDYLTDLLGNMEFLNQSCLLDDFDYKVDNNLVNPFAMAFSDSAWKKICNSIINTCHFYNSNCKAILQHREYNQQFNRFR